LHIESNDDFAADDDNEYDSGDPASESAHEKQHRQAEKRKRILEKQQARERHMRVQKNKVRDEGDPFVKTIRAHAGGWYRLCVKGTWYQVLAEVDLRKETEFGGMNKDGHVMTYEEHAMAEEDKLMEADSAKEEGIKDEDFAQTKEKLTTLRRLLADIQSKQQQERHRLIVHAATNEHSHSRMVLGSLFETILFMVVTGIQILTIRRWFKGAPQLGR
jgi:hypothetical protein